MLKIAPKITKVDPIVRSDQLLKSENLPNLLNVENKAKKVYKKWLSLSDFGCGRSLNLSCHHFEFVPVFAHYNLIKLIIYVMKIYFYYLLL